MPKSRNGKHHKKRTTRRSTRRKREEEAKALAKIARDLRRGL